MHPELVVDLGAQPASDMLKIIARLQDIASDVFCMYMSGWDIVKDWC